MLDPHLKAMLDQAATMPQIDPETIPAEMFRAGYKAMSAMGNQNAYADQLDIRDLKVAGGAGDIPARLYIPKGAASPGPGVVFYHGGGFVIGDLDTHDALCRRLAVNGGFRVIAIDYRLAPENPFPRPTTTAWRRPSGCSTMRARSASIPSGSRWQATRRGAISRPPWPST